LGQWTVGAAAEGGVTVTSDCRILRDDGRAHAVTADKWAINASAAWSATGLSPWEILPSVITHSLKSVRGRLSRRFSCKRSVRHCGRVTLQRCMRT